VALEWVHTHIGTPAMTRDQIRSLQTINAGEWCDGNGIELEKLYGTELHQRGATLPDFSLVGIAPKDLACLRPEEVGDPQYTIEGWLDEISA
jgi:hypothetical protein